jgi:hypothetical protein
MSVEENILLQVSREHFDSMSINDLQVSDSRAQHSLKLQLPTFKLNEYLQLNLSQPVVDLCSFYNIILKFNKAAKGSVRKGRCGEIKGIESEHSPLVLATKGSDHDVFGGKQNSKVELLILDEEEFLLASIASRKQDEILTCPDSSCFQEAIGEEGSQSEGQSEHSYSESSHSTTASSLSGNQLWKPKRSWWEAKSKKNPWIEPESHNMRWRYLWPLIRYHKFLVKCIKKLKRNNIDVKESMSTTCMFLRGEVVAICDHLNAASKFTAEDWMKGLSSFNGWISQDPEIQKLIKITIDSLPTRNIFVSTNDISIPAENHIDRCFHVAMSSTEDQVEKDEAGNQLFDDVNGINNAKPRRRRTRGRSSSHKYNMYGHPYMEQFMIMPPYRFQQDGYTFPGMPVVTNCYLPQPMSDYDYVSNFPHGHFTYHILGTTHYNHDQQDPRVQNRMVYPTAMNEHNF